VRRSSRLRILTSRAIMSRSVTSRSSHA